MGSTGSDSSSDVEELVEELFNDDNDIASQLCTAVAHISRQNQNGDTKNTGRQFGSRNITRGPCSWYSDYLVPNPVYPAKAFRRTFRIPLKLYWRLHSAVLDFDDTFSQRRDAFGRAGHSSHQKLLSCFRRLGTGFPTLNKMTWLE